MMINNGVGFISPLNFWFLYAGRLNLAGQEYGTYDSYQDHTKWTGRAVSIAKDVIELDLKLRPQKEYFRIDLIGYESKSNREDLEKQSNWLLKVAFEHENDYRSWDYELCKLCYIVSDLKVLVSYHDLRAIGKKSIENVLQRRIKNLGLWRMHRVPNSSWLFIFGPRLVSQTYSFKAFTIDSELNVTQIGNSIEVIPDKWKK